MRPGELEAKVAAVNAVHRAANELYRALAPVFAPLVGQQVIKADRSLLARVEKLLPPLPEKDGVQILFDRDLNTILCWSVKTSRKIEGSDGIHVYHETRVLVGNLQGQTLRELREYEDRPHNFTAQHVRQLQARAAELKRQYEQAKSDLHPFDEGR